jgi:GT2 family glycosyltransferase/glycosyltransferase involved in cell wall biosynthesis
MGPDVTEGESLPRVSVVVVNYHGAEDTIACLRALASEVDYPADRLHLVCVDNSCSSAEAGRIERAVPEAEVLRAPENLGFAGGCNLGARHASGDVLGFLNNDARPHRDWMRAAVATLRADPRVAIVASKVLTADGSTVDFADAGLTWFGMGYKRGAGEPDDPSRDAERDVLFATGAAMFVRAGVFAELGGFDERFFMFYEDVDLGWRTTLLGWRVRFQPASLAYHCHHASVARTDGADGARELYLLERNALAALYKNASGETLARALPAALALTVRRATARGDVDATQLEITRSGDGNPSTVDIPRTTLSGILAIDQFVEQLPALAKARAEVQETRRITDADLLPLLRKAMEPAYPLPRYLAAHDILVEAFGLDRAFGKPRNVLVITGDALTERMAGPAIRAWHTAEAISVEHRVRLVTTNPRCEPPGAGFEVAASHRRELPSHVDWADIVVLQGHSLEMVPALREMDSQKIVVCDVYDPMHLEVLEQGKADPDTKRENDVAGVTEVLNRQLARGDFFLCASQRQRHFWLGHLAALGRITPRLYDTDPSLRSLLAEVPFGLSSAPPRRTGTGIRGDGRGVSESDKLVLWAGGVYDWFDPLTLVRAVGELAASRPDLRLAFLGMRHPNPEVPAMDVGVRTRHLARSLGLTGKHVFFNEDWVPYGARQNWLLDADCGVTTHFEHVETTFAFRTRVLDYLWAGLPIVTTDGDSFADLVAAERLGVVVPAQDPDALARALDRVLYDAEFAQGCRERIAVVRERFTWETVLGPLLRFCRDPRPAPDRLAGAAPILSEEPLRLPERLRREAELVREYLEEGGPVEVLRRAGGRVRKVAGARFGGSR